MIPTMFVVVITAVVPWMDVYGCMFLLFSGHSLIVVRRLLAYCCFQEIDGLCLTVSFYFCLLYTKILLFSIIFVAAIVASAM